MSDIFHPMGVTTYRLRTVGLEEQKIHGRRGKKRKRRGNRVSGNGLRVQYIPVKKWLTIE